MNTQEILDKQRRYLWPNQLLYYDEPLPLDHGDGLYVWDVEGNKYLDFFGGILTTSVGHNHPEVVGRVQEQVAKLIHTSTLYPHENQVRLAEELAQITPGSLQTSCFLNSGSEANEAAILLAQMHTGNREIIALRHGYSGRTQLTMSLTAQSSWRIGPTFSADIKHTHNAYCYRCPLKLKYPACDLACAQDVEDVIQTQTTGRIAAVFVEPIQGVGGFITPPDGYFQIVAGIARRYGGLFIADEVQTGLGRTGSHWFGIQHWDVIPDIMTMAKGIANGFPLSSVVTTPEIAQSMIPAGLSISTFGGNPVSVAASLATLEILKREANPPHVERVGNHLRAGLQAMCARYGWVGEIRGKGLMQAIEVVSDPQTRRPNTSLVSQLMEETRVSGLLAGRGGTHGNVLRLTPPLTTQMEDIDRALDILSGVMECVNRKQCS